MAHIPDGILSAPVLATGIVVSAGLVSVSLRRLDDEGIPRAAVLAALFFVASLIHVPLGVGSAHLLLNGLLGLLLGWLAVPALLVALVLQAALFGYGGLVVLGVNLANLALPALLAAALLRGRLARVGGNGAFWLGAAAGAIGVVGTGLLMALSLGASGEPFLPAARLLLAATLPRARVEALMTGTVLAYLQRVAPGQLSIAGGSRD
jgi:cobalt/nickel transport system permease protein